MILGLIHPTGGNSTIGGVPYRHLRNPMTVVGAALEAASFHPARTGRNHLRILCAAAHLPDRRADEVLDLVGLHDAAKRKVRGYSMGMRQRLGLAATLLGNPSILILDEPSNGLDPEGIRWLRGFFRHMAGEGRTVLVSSHLLNEVQEFADRVVILNRGQLVRQGSIAELTAGTDTVVVRSPQPGPLVEALRGSGRQPDQPDATTVRVRGIEMAEVGHLAFTSGVELHELRTERFDLEELFFTLTGGAYAGQSMQQQPPQFGAPQQFGPPPQAGPPQQFGPPQPGGVPWSG
jgi:ABC-2 type transport system ATP-binding protein